MQVNKSERKLLINAIEEWKNQNLLTDAQAEQLKSTLHIRKFDWRPLSIYAFIIAVACAVLSIVVLLADRPLRLLLEQLMKISDAGISSILSVFAVLGLLYARRRFEKTPQLSISNNSVLLFSAFLSLSAIAFWAKTFHVFQENNAGIFLVATILYFGLSIYLNSKVLWSLAFCMLLLGYGVFTVSLETKSGDFLGMNFPFRFVPLCIMLLLFSFVIRSVKLLSAFYKIQYSLSLLAFFCSLWLVTIFGNTLSYSEWQDIPSSTFILWDALFFILTASGMYFGLQRKDWILGNTALAFFLLSLVTRYFEYFWKPLHKSVFFMILALLFWFVGSRAERLWNLKFLNEEA